MAAARIFDREIHVVSSSGVTVVDCPNPVHAPLWLAYTGVHYNAVIPRPSDAL